MKKYKYIIVMIASAMLFAGCGKNGDTTNTQDTDIVSESNKGVSVSETGSLAEGSSIIDQDKLFSDRDLSGEYDVSECESIKLSDDASKCDAKGVNIEGNTITITKEGDYILEGTLSDGMIIVDVDDSDKVQLVLNGVSINSETSAAIYVKNADKVFVTLADKTENYLSNGGGFTAIDDNNIDAVIFSKDDLTLNGTGTLTIDSPGGHGVVSKNDLVITNGTYNITADSHGFSGKDSVAISDGIFNVTAGKDGFHSENDEDDEVGFVYIASGSFDLCVESDGISAVNEIFVAGGSVVVSKSYEGLEARLINIVGGVIDITSSDDGLNATDKRSTATGQSSTDNKRGGFGGQNPMGDTQSDASINIAGGIVYINAEGDGVDSNGYMNVSGGELYVMGPSNGGNGAIDYGISATITGGIVVAAGQSDMAVNFSSDSTQGSMLVSTSGQNDAGSQIILTDSNGNKLIEWTMGKRYNSAVISCPEIVDGGTYTVTMGENTTEITMEGLIYGSGLGGGFGGGFDGGRDMQGEPGSDVPQMPSGDMQGEPNGDGNFDNGDVPEKPGDDSRGEHDKENHDNEHPDNDDKRGNGKHE